MKLHLVLAGTLALAAAGCQRQELDLSAANENQLRDICEGATLAYALFEAAGADKVSKNTLTKVRGGYAAIATVCANPPTNNVEALVAATKAVRAFKDSVSAAKS